MNDKKSVNHGFLGAASVLAFGMIVSKALGAVFRIPLLNIVGSEGMGLYQMVFPLFALCLTLAGGGLSAALSRLVAQCRADGNMKAAKLYFKWTMWLALGLSLLFAILFAALGSVLAKALGNQLSTFAFYAISPALVLATLVSVLRGWHQGFENMFPTAASQMAEGVIKLVLGLALATWLMPQGVEYGVLGAVLGVTASELLALLLLPMLGRKTKRKVKEELKKQSETVNGQMSAFDSGASFKKLLRIALPITFSMLMLPLMVALDSFLVIRLLMQGGMTSADATAQFGLFSGLIGALVAFPTLFSFAIAAAVLPNLSFALASKKKADAKTIAPQMGLAVRMNLALVLPFALLFILFPQGILRLVVPGGSVDRIAGTLLAIGAFQMVLLSLFQISSASLQAMGRERVPFFSLLNGVALKLLLLFFLVPGSLGIQGAALSSAACMLLAFLVNSFFLGRSAALSVPLRPLVFLLLANALTMLLCWGLYAAFALVLSEFFAWLAALGIGGLFYAVLILLLPVFTSDEKKQLPLIGKLV